MDLTGLYNWAGSGTEIITGVATKTYLAQNKIFVVMNISFSQATSQTYHDY